MVALDLSGNSLSGPLPQGIADLAALELLDVKDNSLTGTLPERIGDLSKLKILNLRLSYIYLPYKWILLPQWRLEVVDCIFLCHQCEQQEDC